MSCEPVTTVHSRPNQLA